MKQKGFSLLEVLVAFAILAVALGALMQVFATGLRNTALAEEYTLATLHAESVLATLGTEIALEDGTLGDELDEKYSWRATITEYVDEDSPADDFRARAIPYQIAVEVYWESDDKTRSVILESLRIASTLER